MPRTPPSEKVSRGNLEDRINTVNQRADWMERLSLERWIAHKDTHGELATSLRDYKKESNEWRSTLADLRVTFIPKAEFLSEHRALDAKLHGEVVALSGMVAQMDARLDALTGDVKDLHTEQNARRSVFSDGRSVLGTIGLAVGIVATVLLLLDRIHA
jgi:tetrahydromethanopterin S-methyltransferase subunit F